jgi:hypothetical protein
VKPIQWMLVAVMLSACGSATSSTPARYTSSDMAVIVLQPADAPGGLAYVPQFSGDQDLAAFAHDGEEAATLTADGFELGNGALFVPSDRAQGGHLTADDPIVQGIAALFEREDGASRSLTRYLDDLRHRQLRDATDGPAPRLGDEAYRIDATNSDGADVTVLGWRRSNLVLIVIGTSFPASSVEDLAGLMDGRAAALT